MTQSLSRRQPYHTAMMALLAGCAFAAFTARQPKIARPASVTAPLPQWLTLREASRHSGLSEGLLLRLVREKLVVSLLDGELKIPRAELERVGRLHDLAELGQQLRRTMKARRV